MDSFALLPPVSSLFLVLRRLYQSSSILISALITLLLLDYSSCSRCPCTIILLLPRSAVLDGRFRGRQARRPDVVWARPRSALARPDQAGQRERPKARVGCGPAVCRRRTPAGRYTIMFGIERNTNQTNWLLSQRKTRVIPGLMYTR